MADAVRKEICNNLDEETAHVSVTLPSLFGLTIIKTLECLLRSRVYSGLSLVNLNKKKQRHWMGTRENKNVKTANLRNLRKFKPAKIRAHTVCLSVQCFVCVYVCVCVCVCVCMCVCVCV